MNTIIIYTSSTGFTRKYAGWLSEETGFPMMTLKEAKKADLSGYDRIVYGGWIHASLIAGIKDVLKLKGEKKFFLFAVGGAPENKETKSNIAKVLPDEIRGMKFWYCPGGFDYEHMKAGSKFLMKMFSKMLAGKKDKTEEEAEMAKMIQHSYDISDKKYLDELIQELKLF